MSADPGTPAEIRSVRACDVDSDGIAPLVSWVVEGGKLLICGREGRVLASLHLIPGDDPVRGPVTPGGPDLAPVADTEACPVSGVGYALYRIGETCIALGGPRGQGVVAYVADEDPPRDLADGCLGWISRHGAGDFRFQ
jgi:hypothetical protein